MASLTSKTSAGLVTSHAAGVVEPGVIPYFESDDGAVRLYRGDSTQLLPQLSLQGSVDLVFADPPYFLSNGGVTCQAGRMVSVDKGAWDKLSTVEEMHAFNKGWLALCQSSLKKDGTIWVSGTRHVIFSVGYAMQELGLKLLNDITWEKPNPPPNLSCRYFTHATETLLWAAKNTDSKHFFNYALMRKMAGGRQMKSVWRILRPGVRERAFGRHPTQKPQALLERILLASSRPGDLVLDPFVGSGTTGVCAVLTGRKFIGIDSDEGFLETARLRLLDALKVSRHQQEE